LPTSEHDTGSFHSNVGAGETEETHLTTVRPKFEPEPRVPRPLKIEKTEVVTMVRRLRVWGAARV
jgi:hypothetical protein